MNTKGKKWHRWFVIPLALALALGIGLPMKLGQESTPAYASGVAATNVILTGQDIPGQFAFVEFDIGWENSWRDPVNWDAAWIFIKYKVGGNPWGHATLDTTGHTAATGSTVDAAADGTGVFIYRDAAGSGTVSFTGVQLKWLYGTDGLADNALVVVKVFAIEMVYIPEGAFYVGDYDNDRLSSFFRSDSDPYVADAVYPPYQVTSEAAITVGTADGNLYYDIDTDEDAVNSPGDQAGTINLSFPKGYNDFYIMKYEVSQGQYAEFLNTLTATQATNRFPNVWADRHTIKLIGVIYGTDASNNGTLNEPTDGEWVACNHLGGPDALAYADWAGLRPMTELEYEKAGRGTAEVVDDEYASGTSSKFVATAVTLDYTDAEVATAGTDNPNIVCCNEPLVGGPVRNGALTDADDTREEAGASYYGVMELSGNVWEIVVSVGNPQGRTFDGAHGDGVLDGDGDHDVTNWPLLTGTDRGTGLRGGGWAAGWWLNKMADRNAAVNDAPDRYADVGFRSARTAP